MPADKTLESVHFKSFRWLAKNDVPDGSVTHSGAFEQPAPDGAPDFIIHSADRAIGVEHREVLKLTPTDQLPERAHEGNEDEVIAMTKELTELRGTRLAHVSFSFGRGLPSKRPDRLALARVLSSLVHEHAPADDRHVVLDHTHFVRRGIYSVDRISLYRNDQVRPGHWFALRGGPVTSDCVELLQAAIDDKAKKYASYRNAVRRVLAPPGRRFS